MPFHRCIAQAQTSISDLGPTSMASEMVNMKDPEMGTDSLVLEWENLRHVIKDKVILSEVSGRVEAGEMLASEYSTQPGLLGQAVTSRPDMARTRRRGVG